MAVLGVGAPAAQASLGVPTGGQAQRYTSLTAFEAAAAGRDNGTVPGEQGGGFRHVTWSGVAADGSDPGSTAIAPGHVAALSRTRLLPWGLELAPEVAVANDSFSSVNPHAAGLFGGSLAWAPFNSHTTELQVVAPAAQTSQPVPAQARGIGVVFRNVQTAGTTIQLYNGDIPLLSQPAPVDLGATSFLGLLFPAPVVTRAVITMGTAEMFGFDGSMVKQGGADPNSLVAGNDVVVSEPAPAHGAVAATAGVPVSAPLDTFTESNAAATPRATIDWGDGARTLGTITAGPGGTFLVGGNHTYPQTGSYLAQVTVDDASGPEQTRQIDIRVGPRATTTSVTCSPSPVAVTAATTCTAIVSDVDGGTPTPPTGAVSFNSTTAGATFLQASGCLLGATFNPAVSVCEVQFAPGQLPPNQARVTAAYGGDSAHVVSSSSAIVGVRAQRCGLKTLSRTLRPAGLGVLVTCDARANVRIAVRAAAARQGVFRAFSLNFGTLRATVSAGRPTVLVIKPGSGVLRTLRAALRRHQRVSLKVTLTASSHATQRTTTTRVPALRLS